MSISINANVTQTAKRLVEKVKKSGIYENFGQAELRGFIDDFSTTYGTHFNYVNKYTGFPDKKKTAQMWRDYKAISKFARWCETYNG